MKAAEAATAGSAAAVSATPPAGSLAEVATCWNQIGVQGDGTCNRLAEFVHCRNCPVYANAGVQLLNRPLPAEYRRAWTEHFSQPKDLAKSGNVSAMLFRLGSEWFALPTQAFQEVAEKRGVHSLPHRRQGVVLGLVNIRGELLVCISLAHVLGVEQAASREVLRNEHRRLLVINWEGNRLAFPVEQVHGAHRFHSQELKPPPATIAKAVSTYTQGVFQWRGQTVGCLEPGSLFQSLNRCLS